MAQPDYTNRNEDRYMWWVEVAGRNSSNSTHMPGIAIAYQSLRDGGLYSPKGTESFQLTFIKQAEVITGLAGCLCLGKFSIISSDVYEYGDLESELPLQYHEALVCFAIAKGYEKKPDGLDQAKYFTQMFNQKIIEGTAFASRGRTEPNTRLSVSSITGIR